MFLWLNVEYFTFFEYIGIIESLNGAEDQGISLRGFISKNNLLRFENFLREIISDRYRQKSNIPKDFQPNKLENNI